MMINDNEKLLQLSGVLVNIPTAWYYKSREVLRLMSNHMMHTMHLILHLITWILGVNSALPEEESINSLEGHNSI